MKTETEKQTAIAEFCGWTEIRYNPKTDVWYGKPPKDRTPQWDVVIPNYFDSLNAMGEAEALLTKEQRHHYCKNLTKVCTGYALHEFLASAVFATAEQRAKALLLTIQL